MSAGPWLPLRSILARAAALVGALALLAGPLSAVAVAGTSTDPTRIGLYGSQDPTFDGTYRQSLALLALVASGRTPAPVAVSWLLHEQCADGGFQSFRPDLSKPCAKPSSTSFSGEDTNSTGIAVQALHAVGQDTAAGKGADWLTTHQSADGGWAYYPDGAAGNDPDANSTALGLSAFLSLGRTPPAHGGAGGSTPYDALLALQVGCKGPKPDRGAFTFFGSPNDFATVQAALAVGGGFLPVPAQAGANDAPAPSCPAAKATGNKAAAFTPAQSADFAAGYLVRRLAANGDVVPDPFNAGQTDYGTTANAVLALVATKHGSSEVAAALVKLGAGQASFTVKSGADLPGALATLALSVVAGGDDPASFAGTDLVGRLAGTLTTGAPVPAPAPSTAPPATGAPNPSVAAAATLPATGGDPRIPYVAVAGAGLLAAGSALVMAARRARPR